MSKTICEDCGETEFTIYNNDKGILCCSECGQFKEIAKPLTTKTAPVADFHCSDGLDPLLVAKAIDDEEECDGEMPEEIWQTIKTKEDLAIYSKMLVMLTKKGIKERLGV